MKKLLRLKDIYGNIIRKSSLYITGDKAQNNFVVLVPHIDLEEQLKNREVTRANIEARKLSIDLDKIEQKWNYYKMIEDHKNTLETTRSEISNMIKQLKVDEDKNNKEIEKLLLHVKLVKGDLKNIRDSSYSLEESAALAALSIPNVLHVKTPTNSDRIIHEYLTKPTHNSDSHLSIGIANRLIEYSNSMFYFLKGDAALFEFAASNYCQSFLSDLNFIQFSNADFVRSIIVEGCDNSYTDSSKILTLKDPHSAELAELNRLHLVGGGSLHAFMAYFARHSVQPSFLPLKLFTYGRKYCPISADAPASLFNVNQQSVVNIFAATDDNDRNLNSTFDDVTAAVTKFYESLGYHFRLVYVQASNLDVAESLRLSIQLYSNYLKSYVEVGHMSIYDSYLSKRLLFTYSLNKERHFPKVIAGDLLNVPRLLACTLENDPNGKLLSTVLQEHL